jgi:3-dehydroquinate synthase
VAELEKHLIGMIRMLPGLREQLADVLLDDMLQRFGSDKKHTRERYTLILVGADGAVGLEQMERGVAMDDAIRRAVERTVLALVGS